MNQPALKLTTYFGERQRAVSDTAARQGFLADAMLQLFGAREVATSVMLRGIASFGMRHVLRTDESLSLSEDPPVAIAAVDIAPKISGLVDDVIAMTGRGLVTLERARLVGADVLPDAGNQDANKLTIYVGRQERVAGLPAYRAICDPLSRLGFAWIARSLGIVDELTAEHGMVTSEIVPAVVSIDERHQRGGLGTADGVREQVGNENRLPTVVVTPAPPIVFLISRTFRARRQGHGWTSASHNG
ncbi:MAG: DUF190 domain-containing protein [Mycobacterium sp.]|nr:DUF190 domain-containing protein [Mycobacterium sp.]